MAAKRSLLSPRTREVLGWAARGLTQKEIAAKLAISQHTTKHYITEALRRLGAKSSVQAWAMVTALETRAAVDDAIAALQMLKPGEASKETALKILGLLAIRLSQYSTSVPESGSGTMVPSGPPANIQRKPSNRCGLTFYR